MLQYHNRLYHMNIMLHHHKLSICIVILLVAILSAIACIPTYFIILMNHERQTNCYPGPVETRRIKLNQQCKIFGDYKCATGYENNGNHTANLTRDVPGNYRNDLETICSTQQFCCVKTIKLSGSAEN